MAERPVSARLTEGWEGGFGPGRTRLLAAVGGGYRSLLGAREWLYARGLLKSRRVDHPVVSVGNLTVGGTGKTPAVELAVHTLAALGHRPAIVSRGYGRRTRGIQVVADAATIRLDAEEAGDEPFLLARRLPGVVVVVAENRYEAAARAIERFGVSAIVLDDGFQHRTLRKDLEIVMVRASRPWGNGRLLPAGPLREPLDGLARAHLAVATGAGSIGEASEVAATLEARAPGVPLLTAAYVPTECWEARGMRPVELARLGGARLLAFAGIAAPAGFATTLREARVELVGLVTFRDHHWYSPEDLGGLDSRASELGGDGLVTTEKDWVRLRRVPLPRTPLYVLSVALRLTSGEAAWRAAFEKACSRR